MSVPAKIFISYTHADESYRKRLDVHLAPLKREGLIAPWHDRMIMPSSEWAAEIDQHLLEADIVLLLVSPDFVASDYCFEKEMTAALERQQAGAAHVIPILIRPTDFHRMPFAKLQALPRDAKPVSTWPDMDEALLDIARGIRRVVEARGTKPLAKTDKKAPATMPTKDGTAGARAIKVLFLGAAPLDQVRLALGKEVREIQRNLRESEAGRCFELIQEWAVRPTDFQALLLRHKPDIVHFSGHGSSTGELMFEDDTGRAQSAPASAVGRLFSLLGNGVRCVVLNACYSESQADKIRDHVDCVIGMKNAVADNAAIAFASSFYLGLGHGQSVKIAFELGCNQIEFAGVTGADSPTLLLRPGVDATNMKFAH